MDNEQDKNWKRTPFVFSLAELINTDEKLVIIEDTPTRREEEK